MASDIRWRFWIWHLANALILGTISFIFWSAYPILPEEVPVHFGLTGEPDRFVKRGDAELLILFFLPFFITAMTYVLFGVIHFLQRAPHWINLPNKEAFLAMSREEQRPIFDRLKEMMLLIAIGTNTVLWMAVSETLKVATGLEDRISVLGVFAAVGGLLVLMIGYTIYLVHFAQKTTEKAGTDRPR